MRFVRQQITLSIKDWFDRNFTFKGLLWLGVFLLKIIPDLFGLKDFWSTHVGFVWHIMLANSTVAVTILCALLIWLDHRRVLAKRKPKPHDETTLKGRTLKLRDDIESFIKELGPKPPLEYNSKMDSKEFLEANDSQGKWVSRLHYGFMLRFYERVQCLYWEYGECDRAHLPVGVFLERQVINKESVEQLIKLLDEMAAI